MPRIVMAESRTYENGRLAKIIRYSFEHSPKLLYHNFPHQIDVARVAQELGRREGLDEIKVHLLGVGGFLHDIRFIVGAKDNEEVSRVESMQLMRNLGYKENEIELVGGGISATRVPTKPKNLFEQILCDADLDNLGRDDFFERNRLLRAEMKLDEAKHTYKWFSDTLNFLQAHKYYTESAKSLRNLGLAKNMTKVGEIIMRCPR